MVQLSTLLNGFANVPAANDVIVRGLAMDSREVVPGDAFFALRITGSHGLAFAAEARARGAVAIVWEPDAEIDSADISVDILAFSVVDLGRHLGVIAARFYGDPSSDMYVVGVTGTDGKTSVAWLLAQAWFRYYGGAGMLGTLGVGRFGALALPTHTTPFAIALQRWLAECRDAKAEHAVLEVSSHGLDQHRVAGTSFDCAVLTNLGRDHLDYHGSVESYANAKAKLFQMQGLKQAVLNGDDPFGRRIAAEMDASVDQILYGFAADADLRASDIRLDLTGLSFALSGRFGNAKLVVPLMGRFNASNLLAVLAVLLLQGVALEVAVELLAQSQPVPGRMERYSSEGKPTAIIDYAHTPQALGAALEAAREHCGGRLVCVFGCGGDRDRGKRPEMAAATVLADAVVLTTDNPRGENPEQIFADVQAGFAASTYWELVSDREQAIVQALAQCGPDDCVLIAGKGHEQYQLIGDQKLPFSDQKVVQDWLA